MTPTTPEQAFDIAVENAIQIGICDAKKGYGVYRREDSALNQIGRNAIARQRKTIVDQVEALTKERDALMEKVDKLEWENKGIAEWRGEYALMKANRDKAIEVIVELTKERDEYKTLAQGWVAENAPGGWIDALRKKCAEYISAADEMAMAHKVERDALMSAAKLALETLVDFAEWEATDDPQRPATEAIETLRQAGVQ